jgi:hypothetical protein
MTPWAGKTDRASGAQRVRIATVRLTAATAARGCAAARGCHAAIPRPRHYADQHLGGVDVSLIAVAERLKLATIATLDRRHFGIVRRNHTEVLILIP